MPMQEHSCTFTVHSPDPMDCGEVAHVYHNGETYCMKHYEFVIWAENHLDVS